jgi:hypothetical protein
MVIHIDDLTRLLKESGLPQHDVPPDNILVITFGLTSGPTAEGDSFPRNDGGDLIIDWDAHGNVTSIELMNRPLDHQGQPKENWTPPLL